MSLVPLVVLALAQAAPAAEPLVGSVVDADGKPIGGAEVRLTIGWTSASDRPNLTRDYWRGPEVEGRRVLGRGRADAEGRFRLDLPAEVARSPEPVPVALWAAPPEGKVAVVRLPWAIPAPEGPIRLVVGKPDEAAFRVVGPDGQPDAGARVVVTALKGVNVPDELAGRSAAVADGDGRAVVTAFGRGEVRAVRVESARYGRQEVPVPEGATTIALEPVGRVAGRLRIEGDDRPSLAGLVVRARTWPAGVDLGGTVGVAEAVADARGEFEVPAIAAGRLSLTLDYAALPDLPYRGGPPSNLIVEAGRTATVEVVFRRAVRIRGVVRERGTGAPIAGARPFIQDPAALSGESSPVTDAEGRFSGFILIEQAAAWLHAPPRPYFIPADSATSSHLMPGGATEYTLPPIELARGEPLRGTVVDESGQPVAGALVRATWGENAIPQSVAARADGRGAFAFDELDPQADIHLTAWVPGLSTPGPITARAGADATVTLRVSRSNVVALAGRVVDGAGKPVEGAEVRFIARARDARGFVFRREPLAFEGHDPIRTDADGRFRTPGGVPRAGAYEASIQARGLLPTLVEPITPGDGDTASFGDITMLRLRAVEGVVRDRGGHPLAGAVVSQSGDGPIRTRATTDDRGRFTLPGFIQGKAFLFASKDGYRFHGRPIDTEAGPAEIVLTRADEPPATVLKTLPPAVPREEEEAIARRIMEPYLARTLAQKGDRDKYWPFYYAAKVDPARMLELLEGKEPILSDPADLDSLRGGVVEGLAADSPEEALAVVETINDPRHRTIGYLAVIDALPASERARKGELLDRARLQVGRLVPVWRVLYLGMMADRWLDMGEEDRASTLLREGRALVKEVPPPGYNLLHLAVALARVDLPAALALIDDVHAGAGKADRIDRVFVFDRTYGEIAYRLADRDPAEAERLVGRVADLTRHSSFAPVVCKQMAPADLPRARRLAETIKESRFQGFALGLMAGAVADSDREAARRLIGDAFDLLERRGDEPQGQTIYNGIAAVAATLLPIVERIEPSRLEEFFWRAVALRPPRLSDARDGWTDVGLAANLARYDRDVAAALIAPALARLGAVSFNVRDVAEAVALIDPRHVAAMIEALPDDPGLRENLRKNNARIHAAEILRLHGEARWRELRQRITGWRLEGAEW